MNKKLSNPIFGIIFILLTIWSYIFFDYIWKHDGGINAEYDTEIIGKVSSVTINRGDISLRLKSPKEEKYSLTVTINHNYQPCELQDFIQGGDSVYKPAFCDTLYIFRNNKRYYFIINEVINYKE